jgi:hypothetical protein
VGQKSGAGSIALAYAMSGNRETAMGIVNDLKQRSDSLGAHPEER